MASRFCEPMEFMNGAYLLPPKTTVPEWHHYPHNYDPLNICDMFVMVGAYQARYHINDIIRFYHHPDIQTACVWNVADGRQTLQDSLSQCTAVIERQRHDEAIYLHCSMASVPGVFGDPFYMVIWIREKYWITLPPKPQWQFITWRFKGVPLKPRIKGQKIKIKVYKSSFTAIEESSAQHAGTP